jgi:dUTP pyrophosphatase
MSFQKPKYQLNIMVSSNNPKVKDYYANFMNHHDGDSGIDLYNFNPVEVEFLKVGTVDLEIKCEMLSINTNEYVSYYLVPRSSISKTPFQLANSVGIIDAGYRGNIMAKIRCFDPNGATLPPGAHFQIIAPDLGPIRVNIVGELKKTSRDNGGFGSTNQMIHSVNLFV